ncbi:bacteriochlorophyll 4-vinyl reductase [Roseovarius aestuariivivens]|uniref:bacteriochlorophyll 4-vinyl reductase n=1 Tax=Roseovarius aestuariivivens TaxID=1888910 RepID=UPI0014369455|nr:bacteriochlorophyll 4-vinyl reductase [Roseovarius aestuariivivens]
MRDFSDTSRAVIGPNAILQCRPALEALVGPALTRRTFAKAGLSRYLDDPPSAMVPQTEVTALHRAILEGLSQPEAERVIRDAGRRTGAYIVQNRIPRLARLILRALPARLSGPALLRAIERNAWTFAGDADVFQESGPPMRLAILGNPLAVGRCDWHCAVLQSMFQALVSRRAHVRESGCCARGDPACIFEISL